MPVKFQRQYLPLIPTHVNKKIPSMHMPIHVHTGDNVDKSTSQYPVAVQYPLKFARSEHPPRPHSRSA